MQTRPAAPPPRFHLARRRFLADTAAVTALALTTRATASETLVAVDDMAPGQFTWHPDRQPAGPVSVTVSLDQQRVHVYRNGVRIGVSTCSTGKKGHETPTGVFVMLQKDRNHRSFTCNNAPMPNCLALDKALAHRVAPHMHPVMVLVLTEMTLAPETRSGEDFVILTTEDA
jgi:hypothetical protein